MQIGDTLQSEKLLPIVPGKPVLHGLYLYIGTVPLFRTGLDNPMNCEERILSLKVFF